MDEIIRWMMWVSKSFGEGEKVDRGRNTVKLSMT